MKNVVTRRIRFPKYVECGSKKPDSVVDVDGVGGSFRPCLPSVPATC